MKLEISYGGRTYGITLNEWQKGDKHRVYVNEGREGLGYFDMKTGKFVSSKKRISNPEYHNLVVRVARKELLEA